MSEYRVPLTTVKEILPHGNADALEVAKVYDFEVITRKGNYNVGDEVIYIPIDSVLPQQLENKLFPPGSKITLNKHRVKQIKIRGRYSQGMLIKPDDVSEFLGVDRMRRLGSYEPNECLAADLGITKYEPGPAPFEGGKSGPIKRNKPKENPYFHKYGGLDNFKWYPELFEEGEQVSVTEKIHGTNVRFGMVPYAANNLWRKFKKLLGLAPAYEWVYGSNNVQLQQRYNYTGWYGEDVYGITLAKYNAKDKVKPGEIWYGEVYGHNIQKNYNYGCEPGEFKLVLFDLKYQNGTDSKYADVDEFQRVAKERGFEIVPELFRGSFNKDSVKELTKGDSVLEPKQKVREGVVIKPVTETDTSIGRKVLKMISEKYLDGDQTDFH